jgi:hypothetical protein
MRRGLGTGAAALCVAALAVVASACGSTASGSPAASTTTSTTSMSATAILPPATTRPAYKECDFSTTTHADGTVTPLQCQDGAIDVEAWKHYATLARSILGLGSSATRAQVVSALCAARSTASTPILIDAYRLAFVYYGWSFSSNLAEDTLVTDPGSCS